VRFKVITCERFLIESETVALEFNAHAREFSHNSKVFDIKGFQAGEKIIHHVGARGCGEQIVNVDPENCNIGIFVLVLEAEVGLATRVADGEQFGMEHIVPEAAGLLQTIKAAL
jgi:hypothetical protein